MPTQTAIVGGTPGFHFTNPNHTDWAPRLGFAYRIDEKTVFRGGGGIYYNPNQTNSYTFLNTNPPYATILNCTWSASAHAGQPERTRSLRRASVRRRPRPAPSSTDPWNQPTARMNQWSASLDRQLWSGGGLELQYLGSHSYHLDRSYYNNTPLPGPGSVNSRRPNPLFGVIRTIATDEIANYESLTRHLPPAHEPRFADAGQLHLVAHAGRQHGLQRRRHSDEPVQLESRLRQLQLGHPPPLGDEFRLRHSVLLHIQPDFEGRVREVADERNSHAADRCPFQCLDGDGYRQYLVRRHVSSEPGGGRESKPAGAVTWWDASIRRLSRSRVCIPPPTNFAYGNFGRNLFHGPGAETVDLSLFKNFPIRERLKFQFRFETFALFNHSNFGNPSATINTSSFGNITSLNSGAPGTRNIQLGVKLQF